MHPRGREHVAHRVPRILGSRFDEPCDGLGERVRRKVRVALGDRDEAVPKKELDVAERHAAHDEVRHEGVSKDAPAHLPHACAAAGAMQRLACSLGRAWPVRRGAEQEPRLGLEPQVVQGRRA